MGWAVRSVRRRGVVKTLKVAVSYIEDLSFDRRYGTETRAVVERELLGHGLENRAHAVAYQPTKERPFLSLLQRLALPPASTFVDVGCGKGRVLLLAAQHHAFTRVVGIDFSRTLCERARENITIFRTKVPLHVPIEVIEADITRYAFAGDENVFFLYNPFDATILQGFLERVRESHATNPRSIWLIYSVPVHAAVLEASDFFSVRDAFSIRGNDFRVYRNVRAS